MLPGRFPEGKDEGGALPPEFTQAWEEKTAAAMARR